MAKRVLVVDDAAFMRMMLKDILKSGGYEIVGEAGDGKEALDAYPTLKPDFVTMDIVMPNMGGLDALRALRQADPNAAVIMVSAMGQDALVQEASEAGAKGFIIKPFRPQAVLDTVRGAVGEA
ncbi:MAG: two-component system response regulator [Armatimonadetes bacterium CG_4_10_14_3_um_filter_66_18]|nr:response regulator [Armatimonadota bacterium]OIP04118.1 MAG: two-component system response regulator [Armatimonadetes bacterium CG2_30_66_41]PIU91150.1 MAG: two-component system response regulator [Armatimonadetes bacterium CG06_land_8_20_14_3_00_66_21]PIX42735.1 MAG: two-component system response regulator [Armatimonadetes bacterium CG_4_8_14_3_um_filter_66_20]PIY50989.1 MAG: two-component system response regulator [Armatimonadetes bacterium CG_4_10_14_3_um_filter_66_18]PIZ48690.1 MAG: two